MKGGVLCLFFVFSSALLSCLPGFLKLRSVLPEIEEQQDEVQREGCETIQKDLV